MKFFGKITTVIALALSLSLGADAKQKSNARAELGPPDMEALAAASVDENSIQQISYYLGEQLDK